MRLAPPPPPPIFFFFFCLRLPDDVHCQRLLLPAAIMLITPLPAAFIDMPFSMLAARARLF